MQDGNYSLFGLYEENKISLGAAERDVSSLAKQHNFTCWVTILILTILISKRFTKTTLASESLILHLNSQQDSGEVASYF